MALPQTNAVLTLVQESSVDESYSGPEVPGVEKWAGSVAVYVRERRDRRPTPAGDDRPTDRLLLCQADDPPVDWRSGDWVTFTFRGVVEVVRVRAVEARVVDDMAGVPAGLQTARLTLEAT